LSLIQPLLASPSATSPTNSLETPSVVIDENFKRLDLGHYIEYYVDETNTLTIDQVETLPPDTWKKPHKGILAFGVSPYRHWFRFYLEKKSNKPDEVYIDVDYSILEEVIFYQKKPNGAFEAARKGTLHHKDQNWLYITKSEIFHNEKYSDFYYFSVKSVHSSIFVPTKLWEAGELFQFVLNRQTAFGIYYGLIFFIIGYNLFLGISLREKVYIFYFLYHFGILLNVVNFTGNYGMILDGKAQNWWANHGVLVSSSIAFFFIPFFLEILQFEKKKLRFNVISRLVIIWIVAVIFYTVVFPHHALMPKILNFGILVAELVYLVTFAWLLARGVRIARFIFPGTLVFTSGMIMWLLVLNGHLLINLWTRWGVCFGSGLEALLMSFALADRFKVSRLEKEKAQTEALVHKEQAIENLKKSDEIKNRFLANTSHELRTPLHGIIGLTKHIITTESKNLGTESRRTLELVSISAQRLNDLIHDLLDYSSMVRDKIPLDKKPFDISRIAAESVSLLTELAKDKNIEIIDNISGTLMPYVYGDEKRVLQIFNNLIGNAIKYNQNCTINLDVVPGKHYAHIILRDNGIGIDENQLKSIFEPFQTGDTKRAKGLGLGLSIVQELVENHGGRIYVESEKNIETRFNFTLPFYKQSHAKEFEGRKLSDLENKPELDKTILAVDDEPVNLEIYRHQLHRKYRVLTALSGDAADQILDSQKVDLVLLDIMMPEICGLEYLAQIRKTRNIRELPVILISARDRNEDLIEGLNRGANDYLVKPYEAEQLLIRIDNHLRIREVLALHQGELEKQRQEIYSDLHDHLGSQMTDLKIMFENIIQKKAIDPAFAPELRETMDRAVETLRERLSHMEDIANFEADFLGNLHTIFLRRYSRVERQLFFEYDEHVNRALVEHPRAVIRETLYTVTKEIVTNDLKYGFGVARWNVDSQNGSLYIIFETSTRYELNRNQTGRGTQNIQRRLAEISARAEFRIAESHFIMKIVIPLTNAQ
jgi:two-component system sensor histidine kinase ChiS